MSAARETVIEVRGLHKTFAEGAGTSRVEVHVLQGIDLHVKRGETLAIVGASGSGKSTLLHLMGGLEAPSEGTVSLMGSDFAQMAAAAQGDWRNRHLGFVYQFHHLLPEFSALDNVAMPAMIAGRGRGEAREAAKVMLEQLGLAARIEHQPGQMSGGEQQRVAIARALANHPKLLLADEPTGNLDPANSSAVFQALYEQARQRGVAALIATHNMELARYMDRVFALKDGHLVPQSF